MDPFPVLSGQTSLALLTDYKMADITSDVGCSFTGPRLTTDLETVFLILNISGNRPEVTFAS